MKPPAAALIAWLVAGVLVLVCVPAARSDRLLGSTLSFWLVIAPLLDLAWIERRRIVRRVANLLRSLPRDRRMARSARGQRSTRFAVPCRTERS
jgi:hypothetical protein